MYTIFALVYVTVAKEWCRVGKGVFNFGNNFPDDKRANVHVVREITYIYVRNNDIFTVKNSKKHSFN